MPHPYFFRSHPSAVSAFILLAMLPTLSSAAEPTEPTSPLTMYFDDSQLVEVATRAPKPLRQVAENVSIITAEEIEDMHVHTLLEVLERQSGITTMYFGSDYGSSGRFHLQGTEHRQTLVLIDGVRINNASAGEAWVNFVPLPIIKRVEIIKGPASSVWGSSLGGVINIITKDTGATAIPKASATVTYGEAASRELNGDLAGAAGKVSYYLNAGTMDSDGLKNSRFYDRETVYGKMAVALPEKMSLSVTAGYSDPYLKTADFYSLDISETLRNRNFWGTVYFDAPIRDSLSLHLEAQRYDMRHYLENTKIGQSLFPGGMAGNFLQSLDNDEQTTAFNGRLSWKGDMVDVTAGAETSRAKLDYAYIYNWNGWGPDPAFIWEGSVFEPTVYEERRAVYSNATIALNKFTVTPGLRYDYHSIVGEVISPSLGATYQLANDTLLRTTLARGFSAPPLQQLTGSNGNPLLNPEIIHSAQAGVETFRIPGLQLKANLFHHDVTDPFNDNWENTGRSRYNGVDLTVKTLPWHDLTLTANGVYAITDSATLENDDLYSTSLVLDYNDRGSIKAQLAGRYSWWNTAQLGENPKHDTFLWDASVTKTVGWQGMSADLFLAVHNLFDGSQYWDYEYPNPDRWAEVGARFKF
jgi:vitamin B12 transporter